MLLRKGTKVPARRPLCAGNSCVALITKHPGKSVTKKREVQPVDLSRPRKRDAAASPSAARPGEETHRKASAGSCPSRRRKFPSNPKSRTAPGSRESTVWVRDMKPSDDEHAGGREKKSSLGSRGRRSRRHVRSHSAPRIAIREGVPPHNRRAARPGGPSARRSPRKCSHIAAAQPPPRW